MILFLDNSLSYTVTFFGFFTGGGDATGSIGSSFFFLAGALGGFGAGFYA